MENYVVWLDSKEAFIFALKTTGIEKSHIKKNEANNHRTPKKDMHRDPHVEIYFKGLAEKIKDAAEILLLGPGLAKNHFKDYLEEHQAKTLFTKIIGLEPLEKSSENQILASARQFFKHYDLFNNPI